MRLCVFAAMCKMKAFKATVSGKVQGVWFRGSTRDEANKHNLVGWIKNMPDGSVYLEAEGEEENLKEFEKWLNIGSSNSCVENVEIEWIEPAEDFSNFDIQW